MSLLQCGSSFSINIIGRVARREVGFHTDEHIKTWLHCIWYHSHHGRADSRRAARLTSGSRLVLRPRRQPDQVRARKRLHCTGFRMLSVFDMLAQHIADSGSGHKTMGKCASISRGRGLRARNELGWFWISIIYLLNHMRSNGRLWCRGLVNKSLVLSTA